ncbi:MULTISPECIES: DUF4440 domain-containing protein [Sphingobium]|uniref:DUF4440 domain-containing protein n=1 Tax=Sphingobium lignivorans TaxID=2735886 RepID=A0ABR6NB70_9SPHN|nr:MULTISPECIES: DUF4440 domain-containing protein [Sphingobium]MBB5984525.1 hypothetical protein [Sphingobium lignivorans]BAK65203.1 hypothetical protein SLG_05280 [Sphingobium sp. SYK-6]
MEDDRVWSHEKALWTGSAEQFAAALDESCLMVVPAPPYVLEGRDAIESIAATPRWAEVTLAHGCIVRPQDGLIVAAYEAYAKRPDATEMRAWCTSTWRRIAHDDWRLVQHQQMHAADGPLRSG